MKTSYLRVAGCMLAVLAMAGALVAFPGCGAESMPGVDELWSEMQKAMENIDSLHMEVSFYYQNTKYGSGLTETYVYDFSGSNFKEQHAIFGNTFSEVVVVGGTMYTKLMNEEKWTQQPAPQSQPDYSQQLEGMARLPQVASSKENLGLETVKGGQEAYHLTFSVDAGQLSSLFPKVDPASLSTSSGAKIDLWVAKDTNYLLMYEATITNYQFTDPIGIGDLRIVNTIGEINQPIAINPPV